MLYGSIEHAHAEPFAEAIARNAAFRAWVLRQTKFKQFADGARLLDEEMKAKRSRFSTTWWRSHYTEACRCEGCSGQETDLLAVFEAQAGLRFALHVEVKQPRDRFPAHKNQAGSYASRAACWTTSPPKSVIRHSNAATLFLCSRTKLAKYKPHLSRFGSVITFEDVAGWNGLSGLSDTDQSAPKRYRQGIARQ
ncbi:hypothetical protein PZ895_13985 [Mesorhizobium sp. YIM 152430]|uniref:hypothetical protein n=1 Tax=Mesorhizobium sp. YIM 152430 TaxID=3031761 RepID=UPI0023DB50F9|nr:hypothetical protein [Mesorhizobium sp. YIM 152430]MDF1600874.1 hypothetical protein [Mesorhizobium sp. YIM 152430]